MQTVKDVPGITRHLLVVGAEQQSWLSGFRQVCSGRGYEVVSYPLDGSLTSVLVRNPFGIIIFDTGEDGTTTRVCRIRECTRYLGVPIVAITGNGDSHSHSRLLAAGAHCHLSQGESPDRVLQEIENRADTTPVLAQLRERLLDPYVEVALMTFREMAGAELQIRAIYQKRSYKMFGDVSAIIGLFGQSEGAVTLSFPQATATQLARQIFPGMILADDDELVRDCVGEILNVIAGQAKGRLAGTPYAFNISTPTVVAGPEHVVRHRVGMPCLIVVFNGPLGEFAMQVCMGL